MVLVPLRRGCDSFQAVAGHRCRMIRLYQELQPTIETVMSSIRFEEAFGKSD